MLFIKKEISGTPTLVPLTGDVAADPEGVICYVADQDKLSDPVDITSCVTTSSTTFEAPYDGNLYIKGYGPIASSISVTVNGTQINAVQSSYNNSWIAASGAVSKGDTVKLLAENTNCYVAYAQWYCDRDYDHDGSPWLSPYIANVGGGGGDIGCHWCSTATYACITNSSNVSLANLTATKAQVGPFTFCGDNGYIYNGANVVTGRILACEAELPSPTAPFQLFYEA